MEFWLLEVSCDENMALYTVNFEGHCSLPHQGIHEIKRMYLASRTHGLFVT
jgi:hypothetical protein